MGQGKKKPWHQAMPDEQFDWMRRILSAPSPIGWEAGMTYGVLKPFFETIQLKDWGLHQFKGNAGLVLDTHPGENDRCSVMLIGHADKIRLQVRSIGDDGKIWINSDSFLPTTLIGHEVLLFCQVPGKRGEHRVIEGGTVEALGAIHFAKSSFRTGDKGISPEMLYVELQLHGDKRKEQVIRAGVRPGDPILLNRAIRRGFGADTFYGAYLDNGLGCFVVAEVARLLAERGGLKNVRTLLAVATYEEIGRFGSRVLAGQFKPDVVIGIDVDHDYQAAPGVGDQRFSPISLGKGVTLTSGSIASEYLNRHFETVAEEHGIPIQQSPSGRDTGTDAMASVLAGVDSAAASLGIPVRNMHTISEVGHTGDVLSCIHLVDRLLGHMDRWRNGRGLRAGDFKDNHPRLDHAKRV